MPKDEQYIIDLCDAALGLRASRQHRFDFLRGDRGTRLAVDAYYADIALVIEYRERQHSEAVTFFDKPNRMTVSGVHRGEQRKLYDQRRRDVLPQHGIELVELDCTDFPHDNQRRLHRIRERDEEVIRLRLAKWLRSPTS